MAEKINAQEFDRIVKEGGAVLVDFYADWCGPCKMMAPVLEQVASEKGDKCKFFKVNIDEEGPLAVTLGIMSIPTLILFKDGKEAKRQIGLLNKAELSEMIESI